MSDPQQMMMNALLARGELLAQLTSHPSWSAFVELISDVRLGILEDMAQADDPGNFRYAQGFARALYEIIGLPASEVAKATQALAEEDENTIDRSEIRSLMGLGADPEGDI